MNAAKATAGTNLTRIATEVAEATAKRRTTDSQSFPGSRSHRSRVRLLLLRGVHEVEGEALSGPVVVPACIVARGSTIL